MRGVSIKDIAAKLGISHSTVSRALNGNPRISEATRARVQEAAVDLGYLPDAKLRELMSRVRRGRKEGFQGMLGLLYLEGQSAELSDRNQLMAYTEGIQARAEQMGYRTDSFWLEESGYTSERLREILRQRGIDGVILMKPPARVDGIRLPWESFAWVALGFAISEPAIHMVTPDWTGDAARVTRHLLDCGYKRLGFIYDENTDRLVGNAWLGGYATEVLSEQRCLHIFRNTSGEFHGLMEWVEEEAVDALLVHSDYVEKRYGKALPEIPILHFNLHPRSRGSYGLATNCEDSGRSAVDLLVGQLRRGEWGVPPFQKKLRTQGRWMRRVAT